MEKELRYIKIGNLEFKDKDGTLYVRKEIFPGSPTWYIAEVPDLVEAIQATREETVEEIREKLPRYGKSTNGWIMGKPAEYRKEGFNKYDEKIRSVLDSLKAQKKGIRR